MRRRDILALIGSAGVRPLGARAQQQTTSVIGFLSGAWRSGPSSPDIDGLGQGLAEAGYVLGHNLSIQYRWAEGQFDRLPALTADLISRRVALIATATLPAANDRKGGEPDDTGCVRHRRGPGQSRSGRKSQSTWRQRDWRERFREPTRRKAVGTPFSKPCPVQR